MASWSLGNDDFYARHPHMPASERAKIFIPFEPLKGYRALLAERERQMRMAPRVDLTDEQRQEISSVLAGLHAGSMVSVVHYVDGHYETTQGLVSKVKVLDGTLVVVAEGIAFADIVELTVMD